MSGDSPVGPSVVDGQIRYVSVSQLDRFDERVDGGCARKWYFEYVVRRPKRDSRATRIGSLVHGQIERYLLTGRDGLGPLARAGYAFIPKPGRDLIVERSFGRPYELLPGGQVGPVMSQLTASGVPFIGKADLIHRRGFWLDSVGKENPECFPELVDWKTTKRIADVVDPDTGEVTRRGWAKTAAQIASGWQAVGYARVALRIFPDAEGVRVGHGYFQTEGRRDADKRSCVLARSEVDERWAAADDLVEHMRSAAGEKEVERIKPNYRACAAYGGCPHRAECPRDPKEVLRALSEGR
jgi:hypothetical protein